MLAAPLRRGGSTIGTLAVAGRAIAEPPRSAISRPCRRWRTRRRSRSRTTGSTAELRALAVRHERERIAREIHDGLAQVLGYVNTKSQAVEGLLEAGRLDEARVQMAELSAAARSIYVDVREAILGLSEPRGRRGRTSRPRLRDYADRFAEASKLAVSVRIEPAVGATGDHAGGPRRGLRDRPRGADERAQARRRRAG